MTVSFASVAMVFVDVDDADDDDDVVVVVVAAAAAAAASAAATALAALIWDFTIKIKMKIEVIITSCTLYSPLAFIFLSLFHVAIAAAAYLCFVGLEHHLLTDVLFNQRFD